MVDALGVNDAQPRRGSRKRQPTRKAEELTARVDDESETSKSAPHRALKDSRATHEKSSTSQGSERDEQDDDADREDNEEAEGSSDDGIYCICRKRDDGSPMVQCAGCEDWFHLRCIGLTKRAADKLDEYMCEKCSMETGRLSKNVDGTVMVPNGNPEKIESSSVEPPTKRKASVSAEQGVKKQRPGSRDTVIGSSHRYDRSETKASAHKKDGQQNEAVRLHATNHLLGLLVAMFDPQGSALASESSLSPSGVPDTAAKRYAEDLEQAVFDAFAEAAPGRPSLRTAQKMYKDRFRTLSFSLRDKTNEALRTRIVSGDLSPDVLATLPSEQLANDAIRARTEKAREEALRQSVLKQQSGGPMRKMTHKGEIDIEHENVAPLPDAFVARDVNQNSSTKRQNDLREDEGDEVTTASGRSQELPASSSRTNTFNDEQLASPTNRTEPDGQTKSPEVVDARGSGGAGSPPTSSSFDFSNVWQAKEAKKDGGAAVADTEGDHDGQDSGSHEAGEASNEEDQAETFGTGYQPNKASDDFIDTFLQGISGPSATTAATSEEGIVTSSTPTGTPPPAEAPIFWQGAISMPDEASISGTVRQIGGRHVKPEPQTVESFFPSNLSVLEGRLPTKVATDYLIQSHYAARTELLVFKLEKSFESDALAKAPAPTPSSVHALDAAFSQLLSYLQRRQRYGVLLPSRKARGKAIKDFYIAPLPKDSPIPIWLDKVGSLPFLGFEEARQEDMMLLVAVVFKGTFGPHSAPVIGNDEPSSSTSKQQPAPQLDPNKFSTMMSGNGSNALQDLLKAVGGDPTYSTPSGLNDPTLTSRLAADDHARYTGKTTSQQHVTAVLDALHDPSSAAEPSQTSSALAQVPQQDISNVLTSNPDLLRQLLKTLGGGISTSSDAVADATAPTLSGTPVMPGPPPPGPPPVRPPMAAAPTDLSPTVPAGTWGQTTEQGYARHANDQAQLAIYGGPPPYGREGYSGSGNGWQRRD